MAVLLLLLHHRKSFEQIQEVAPYKTAADSTATYFSSQNHPSKTPTHEHTIVSRLEKSAFVRFVRTLDVVLRTLQE